MFPNLEKELRDKRITNKAVANLIGCTEKTLWNKMNDKTEFTLAEALTINENIFPEYELRYLFKRNSRPVTDSTPA